MDKGARPLVCVDIEEEEAVPLTASGAAPRAFGGGCGNARRVAAVVAAIGTLCALAVWLWPDASSRSSGLRGDVVGRTVIGIDAGGNEAVVWQPWAAPLPPAPLVIPVPSPASWQPPTFQTLTSAPSTTAAPATSAPPPGPPTFLVHAPGGAGAHTSAPARGPAAAEAAATPAPAPAPPPATTTRAAAAEADATTTRRGPFNGGLTKEGRYNLKVLKAGRIVGCKAPAMMFPGAEKYGCVGQFGTPETCDSAKFPVRDTRYVQAVHEGCETAEGRGTYGYAYDDGVGLKQCAPVTRYEWVLCPTGAERKIEWKAKKGKVKDSIGRFRITNNCEETLWIQQDNATADSVGEDEVVKIGAKSSHTISIPNRGLPSTRYIPKFGCDSTGNACLIQSLPPCPLTGCDLPIDTKFEASWGCRYWTGVEKEDRKHCALTGQGNPSTYQDWWDGSAVDGWTVPFSVLTENDGWPLTPPQNSSLPPQPDTGPAAEACGDVICAKLDAAKLCPHSEFMTPQWQ